MCRHALAAGLGIASLFTLATQRAAAQGCIAVRGADMCLLHPGVDGALPPDANLIGGDWLADVSYRYLHSTRHFVGDEEQLSRQEKGNQVINHQHFVDFDLQYAITPRWSVGLLVPYAYSDRSQVAGTTRFTTHADGIGDLRLTGYSWLWDPMKHPKGNIQLGLGLKAPTGQDDVTDHFLTAGGGSVVHAVDQSIQPGDGGWGVTVEFTAYREIFNRTVAFAQGFYLVNPEDTNGVLTGRDNAASTPATAAYYEHFMSIPDQYFARAGLSYTVVPKWGLSVSLAGRIEGVPDRDLIGPSDGFRRPGYAVSIEPGIEVMKGRYTLNFSVPVALYRNRQKSLADDRASAVSGTDVHGDAAFADYVITGSLAVRF